MAIEALGSVMSLQAQTVQTSTPKVTVDKSAAEFTEGAALNQAVVIDKTTPIVTQVTEGGDQKGNKQNGGQAQNEQLRKAVEQINKKMSNSEAVYGIHEATNRITIKIVDKETKETIKEFPPEQTLDMIAKVWELAGIMVDEKL